MQCTMKKGNEVRKTNTSTWPSNSSTFWKQMTISDKPQDYPDWTYLNIFGASGHVVGPHKGARLHGHNS